MTSPRLALLDEITERLSDAVQADLENGVKWLNENAAAEFKQRYPGIQAFHQWLHDLYFQELGDE